MAVVEKAGRLHCLSRAISRVGVCMDNVVTCPIEIKICS